MTTDTQSAPTDAEIEALAVEHEAFGFGRVDARGLTTHGFDPDGLGNFSRAVLAKWGTPPAVAGESVDRADAVNLARNALGPYNCAITKKGVRVLAEAVLSMDAALTTPTQAQAGAVPMYRLLQSGVDRIEAADEFLSDDTTTWAIDPNGIFVGNIYGGHVLRPARRRIKGGQHGDE